MDPVTSCTAWIWDNCSLEEVVWRWQWEDFISEVLCCSLRQFDFLNVSITLSEYMDQTVQDKRANPGWLCDERALILHGMLIFSLPINTSSSTLALDSNIWTSFTQWRTKAIFLTQSAVSDSIVLKWLISHDTWSFHRVQRWHPAHLLLVCRQGKSLGYKNCCLEILETAG